MKKGPVVRPRFRFDGRGSGRVVVGGFHLPRGRLDVVVSVHLVQDVQGTGVRQAAHGTGAVLKIGHQALRAFGVVGAVHIGVSLR